MATIQRCELSTGKELKNVEDIRSLVSALVFRQSGEYTEEDILAMTKKCLEGSDCEKSLSEYNLKEMISHCLDISERNNDVKCWNGKYRTMISTDYSQRLNSGGFHAKLFSIRNSKINDDRYI